MTTLPPPSSRIDCEASGGRRWIGELDLVDWRRGVADLYAAVRGERSPAAAHALWRAGRDKLFREHPQSPLLKGDRLFLPLRDATAGAATYGGGRYLLDTAKGADLGSNDCSLIIDLNFLYHPSCRYHSAWQCPLAPPENTVTVGIHAGEKL